LKGKIIVMEFWIKNCGYCIAAFNSLKELQTKYGDEIEILSINAYDKNEDIAFFYTRENPVYKMLYNGNSVAKKLGINSYPTVLIIDTHGPVLYSSTGFNKEKIEAIITQTMLH